MDIKEIKQEIRQLKKLKLQCQPGSKERLNLGHKIKDLKKKLVEITISDPAKDKIISEILKVEAEQKITPRFADIGIDLHKYTLEQLKYHLNKITKGV